jgi:cytoskeletal protein CcmA (bactofilin family)
MADDNQVTVIGSDTHIKGEMSFDRSCRLLGGFEGTINAKGQLHVANGATCKAEVEAADIVVDGNIEGNVTAREKIQLNAKAKVNGDVIASKLVVAEGATFSGHVSVGADAVKGKSTSQAGQASAQTQARQDSKQAQPAGAK